MQQGPDFSIITPSYNMLGFLRRCHRSVVDQQGVSIEHIVMDGGSTDGTAEWLASQSDLRPTVQADDGMYDAINKGIDQAQGEIIAYLNCDEQYLPGTLPFVRDYMVAHPEVDLLFGGALLVRPDGSLVAYRKAYAPRWAFIASSHLYLLSCTMFLRRRVFDAGLRFDRSYRIVADWKFVLDCLAGGYRAAHAQRYFSTFAVTGANLSEDPRAAEETARVRQGLPVAIRWAGVPLNLARLTSKLMSGAYRESFPLSYEIYTDDDLTTRTDFAAPTGSWRWRFE